jgi:hypothetical protein
VLISTKNVARGIGGQIRFMAAAVQRFGSIRRHRALTEPRSERVMTFSDQMKVVSKFPNGVDGKLLRHKLDESKHPRRSVRASEPGILRACLITKVCPKNLPIDTWPLFCKPRTLHMSCGLSTD